MIVPCDFSKPLLANRPNDASRVPYAFSSAVLAPAPISNPSRQAIFGIVDILVSPAATSSPFVTAVQIIGRESRQWRDGRGILNPPDIKVHLTRTNAEARWVS